MAVREKPYIKKTPTPPSPIKKPTGMRNSTLVLIVDNNGLQISGDVTKVMNFTPIAEHFRGFGWVVREIDGHNMEQIVSTLESIPVTPGKPTVIVAKTVKGKGYSKAEGVASYHFWLPTPEEMAQAVTENTQLIERLQKNG